MDVFMTMLLMSTLFSVAVLGFRIHRLEYYVNQLRSELNGNQDG